MPNVHGNGKSQLSVCIAFIWITIQTWQKTLCASCVLMTVPYYQDIILQGCPKEF